ncbi:uncharacterized protein [Nicotiana tomentosiformis]|uniref:uncharacterized protein n=1 Tax=Nicotiana tomentosiformis TaxID=4098 RepID=UPI00388CDF8B
MNSSVEAANKNIKKILRKMVDNYKQWHEKLPLALLGYCTTVRTSTGETPYLLVYGTVAVIPAEVEIPSLRIIQEAELSNVEWVRSRYEQLSLIDGKRMNTIGGGAQTPTTRTPEQQVHIGQVPGVVVIKPIISVQPEVRPEASEEEQKRLERFKRYSPPTFSGTTTKDS